MEEDRSRGNDDAGPWNKRSPGCIAGAQTRMRDGEAVDRENVADRDAGVSERNDCLDERRGTARTSPVPKIPALKAECRDRPLRRTDEDEIADGGRTIKRHDPPKPKRLARREVDPEPAKPAHTGKRHPGDQAAGKKHSPKCHAVPRSGRPTVWRSDIDHHLRAIPGRFAWRIVSACFNASAVCCLTESCCAVRINGHAAFSSMR